MFTSTLVKKANRLLQKKANELLNPLGITHAYSFVLMELFQQDGLTQFQLYTQIGIEQPTLVRTLDRMERDGFIKRTPSPSDRRVSLIMLSEKAKQCRPQLLACAEQLNDIALVNFKAKECEMFNMLIKQIINNLEV